MTQDSPGSEIAGVFSGVAADYDRSGVDFFGLFAANLVDRLEPQPGWHVLDVGSGRGAVVFALAAGSRRPGRVTAVDVAPGMVDHLRADVSRAGLDWVSVSLADIATLEMPDSSVDAATASMVLFFLPDLGAGLAQIRRVLRPEGVLAFSVFGPSDPRWTPVYSAFLPYLPDATGDLSRPRHPDLFDEETITATLQSASFSGVACQEVVHDIRFSSVEQWHTWSWSVGLRGVWLSIPEHIRPGARDAVLEQVSRLIQDDGSLVERFCVLYATARA